MHLHCDLKRVISTLIRTAAVMAALASPLVATATPSRVTVNVNDTDLVALQGGTHPMALPQYDKGLVDPKLKLDRVQLVLQRSRDQDAALKTFLAEQQDPASPNFHRWLHAAEFGSLYGPSDADIAAVTGWLAYHGFSNIQVSQGRVNIEFDATAGQVQEAFHTEIHRYLVNGIAHIANDRNPMIPAALAPVVNGIASLHDFRAKHQSILGPLVTLNQGTHLATPVATSSKAQAPSKGPNPLFNFNDPNNGDIRNEDVAPYDFAMIYNLIPLWNAGVTGKGVTIGIAAQSDVKAADITTFRKFFGLSKFSGTLKQIANGSDPGIVDGDNVENTLDVEWAGASAPDAAVVLVASKATATTTGAVLSISYIIDNEIAQVMSASYGECEKNLGTSGNAQLNSLYEQGSAEGISLFESAGDQGSAGCDNSDAATPNAASGGLQVNGFASSPYITGVGGTDLLWQEDSYDTYWGSNTANNASALGYIPELPWNSSCASTYLLDYVYTDQTSSEELCNNALNYLPDMVKVVGGSGGKSATYAKPSWQTGTGVPADGKRDVPDVALFASGGLPDNGGSAYLMCVSSNSSDGACDYSGDNITAQEVGGTSVSSPAMAGIMALVVQKAGKAQGLANTMLYKLAAKDNRSSCNSSTVKNGNSCVFYDVTFGTNAVPCIPGTLNCVTNTSGDEVGIISGYATTPGYDLATGLGSVNAYNLVNAWVGSGSTTPASLTVSPTTVSFASTAANATSAAQTVTLKNSGSATVTFSSIALAGAEADDFGLSNSCGSTLTGGASCTLSVTFKPVSTGSKSASISIADNATGSPQSVSLAGTGTTASKGAAVTLSASSVAFGNQASGTTSAAKTVTVTNSGSSSLSFSSIAVSGAEADDFALSKTCGSTLAAGASCTLSVSFKPVSTGSKSASISIADSATGSPQTVIVTGTGTTASAATVTVSPTSLAFGKEASGTNSAAKTVTLTNGGSSTLSFSSIAVTGGEADDFVLSKTCGSTLAAKASCTVSVSFKPVSAGSKSASISIADSASGSPQTVALTGTGT
jgi:hypothetical protein